MSENEKSMKPILSYLDFREYIRDYYLEKKAQSGFSFRDFSKAAGFSSPVFIKLIIEGKTNVTHTSISALCDAMGLRKKDRQYFKSLVLFGQAEDIDSKIRYIEKLKTFQSSLSVNELSSDQFAYFSKWHHQVIKELLDLMVFDGDYEKLGALVTPPISAQEAKESVALLEKLRLIERNENGAYRSTAEFVTTEGLTNATLAIRSVQKTMAQHAARAIDSMPKENRDISGVSIAISQQSMDAVGEELRKCRQRIFEIASKDTMRNSVYRVNLHLFPISETVPMEKLKKNQGTTS
jgi:uncharacterized protein (TIGR02147 family)